MIRLIHALPSIAKEDSGPSYSVVRLCEQLIITSNISLKLVCLDWDKNSTSRIPFFCGFPIGFGGNRLGRSPQMLKAMNKWAVNNEITLLHSHGMWQMNAIYPAYVAKKFKIPLVFSPRGSLSIWALNNGSILKKFFWPFFQKPALNVVTCFHATSNLEYQEFRALGFTQPIAVIPNGIDTKIFNLNGRRSKSLLYLGRIHPKKGIDQLLRAWALIQDNHPEWILKIAGDDVGYHGSTGYLNHLKKLSNQLNLNRVEFLGPVFGVQKEEVYKGSSIFVLPTYSENFGMTVAEALSFGLPSIVSLGAPWSGLIDTNSGWWVKNDPKSLSQAILHAVSLPEKKLREMGLNGKEWMERDFSWNSIAEEMNQVYEWLLDQKKPKPECVFLD